MSPEYHKPRALHVYSSQDEAIFPWSTNVHDRLPRHSCKLGFESGSQHRSFSGCVAIPPDSSEEYANKGPFRLSETACEGGTCTHETSNMYHSHLVGLAASDVKLTHVFFSIVDWFYLTEANNAQCGWDDGDCCECDCTVGNKPSMVPLVCFRNCELLCSAVGIGAA